MILMYTSGTTGVPKGALLPHRKTLFNSLNAQLFFELRRDDHVLVVLPLFHSFGLSILSLPTLYAGGALHLEPHHWRDVELDADALRSWGAEHLASFKLPREFVAVQTLPHTATSKVQKHWLGGDEDDG